MREEEGLACLLLLLLLHFLHCRRDGTWLHNTCTWGLGIFLYGVWAGGLVSL